MKFFIIFTSTQSNNKFRYRRRIHETSKSPHPANQYSSTSSEASYHQMNLREAHRRRWKVLRPESNLWLEIKKVFRPESYGLEIKELKIKLWEDEKHVGGDRRFWDLCHIFDSKEKRFWDLSPMDSKLKTSRSTNEKLIGGDGRYWDLSPMDSKLKTWRSDR